MMEKNFSPLITMDQIRKKWVNMMEEYHKAILMNNTDWRYYDLFTKYLGDFTLIQNYAHWNTEWINELIKIRIKHTKLFSNLESDNRESWDVVECEIRKLGLPHEYSVQKIYEIWISLIKTFKIIHKYYCEGKAAENVWPFYDEIKGYFSSCDPEGLENPRGKRNISTSEDEDFESIKNDYDDANYDTEYSLNEAEEFRWTQQWTESFIHIRLQNDQLFKQKKQAWKDLHRIMMKNGFPKAITVNCIRRKWIAIFEEYQKAVAINNTKWLYYNIVYSYIGKSDMDELFRQWTDNWIKMLIDIRLENDQIFKAKKLDEDDCWAIIEREIRNKGLPPECCVRNIHLMWSSLIKTFKIKHKYIDRSRSSTWEFYDSMKQFFMTCDAVFLNGLKKLGKTRHESINDADSVPDNFICDMDWNSDDNLINDNRKDITESCRACLGKTDIMTSLYESQKNIIDMIIFCTSIEISDMDSSPKQICQTCIEELEIAYRFKKKCEDTDKLLKTYRLVNEVKCEMDTDPSMDLMINSPAISCHLNSDNDDVNDIDFKPDIEKCQKTFKHTKRKSDVTKKRAFKSKNVVMVPVLGETGKTILKRRYIYWKVCDICGKSTQRMTEHMKGHSEVKSHTCPKCPKTFTYSASLQSHLRTHDPTPLKICQVCGKEFFRNLTYKRHLVYHANERKFSCDTCGKTFNTSDILRVHIRSHTGERPYSCKTCGKSFYSRGCVSRHQKTHRKQIAEKL